MQSLYVYAIVDQPDRDLPAVRGIADAVISGMRGGDLMAIISEISEVTVPLNRDNLLAHERVIEALMHTHAVLPARFGTTTERVEQIQKTLETNGANYRANLDRVRDRVEIALRVGWEPEPEQPDERPQVGAAIDGRSYMQALLARSQHSQRRRNEAEELAANLTGMLTDLADASVEQVLPTPRLLLKAAYLVRRANVPEIRHRIDALRADYPALTFLATGPWPAYSFVVEGRIASGTHG